MKKYLEGSFAIILIIGGITLAIGAIVGIITLIVISGNCSDAPFRDIIPTNIIEHNNTRYHFYMEPAFVSFVSGFYVYDVDKTVLGFYFKDLAFAKKRYVYRKYENNKFKNVATTIKPLDIIERYNIDRCEGNGPSYTIKKKIITIGKDEYNIYKNGENIGYFIKNTILQCNPNVKIYSGNELIAELLRDCITLVHRWDIVNNRLDLIENYVLGHIAHFIYDEESQSKNKNKNNK